MENYIPENNMQELWFLSGKVEAVLIYIETETYPKTEVIYSMLGGDVRGLPMPENE